MKPKEQAFLNEYRKDFNGAAAARRMGYSEGSAKTVAYRFLHSEDIRRALEAGSGEGLRAQVIGELQRLAFSAEPSEKSGKLKALELLGKHLGIFEGKPQTEGKPVEILEDL